MTDADGSCLCAQERLCDMWMWDCRGSHQSFKKHAAWLSTNWDVNLDASKFHFFVRKIHPDPERDMDLIWGPLAFAYFFQFSGLKKNPTKRLNCGEFVASDQRVSFLLVHFFLRGSNSSHWWFRSLVWWCLAAAPKRFYQTMELFPSATKIRKNVWKNQSSRPIKRRSLCFPTIFLTKNACDAPLSVTSCPFKQLLTMRGWRAMRGMAMLCFPVDLTSWFHSRSWVNSMVNWSLGTQSVGTLGGFFLEWWKLESSDRGFRVTSKIV